MRSRVRTRTHGSVGRRRLRPPLTRSQRTEGELCTAAGAGRTRAAEGNNRQENFSPLKSDGPHFSFREKSWRAENPIDTTWLDSARVARRSWEECAWKGYGLSNVCEIIGYKFKHHDALEDAKASGQVMIATIKKQD